MNNPTINALVSEIFESVRCDCPQYVTWEANVMGDHYGKTPTATELSARQLVGDAFSELTLRLHVIESETRVKLWLIYGERRHCIEDAHPKDKNRVMSTARTLSNLMRVPLFVNGQSVDKPKIAKQREPQTPELKKSHKSSRRSKSHKSSRRRPRTRSKTKRYQQSSF